MADRASALIRMHGRSRSGDGLLGVTNLHPAGRGASGHFRLRYDVPTAGAP